MDRSWVETTCPPGWEIDNGFDRDGCEIFCAYTQRVPARDGDGCTVWITDEAAVRRLAWERWSLSVLGGRCVWTRDGLHPALAVYGDDQTFMATRIHDRPEWDIYIISGGFLGYCQKRISRSSTNPVEALARLASLTLTTLGPKMGES